MALLGAQLVISLIMLSIIQKVGSYFSFAKWLMCSTDLIRYLHPTDSELRQLANLPKDKWKAKRNTRHQDNGPQKRDTFHVARSLDIDLETVRVSAYDVVHLRYYIEYQWLLDFALYSLIVYLTTEIYLSFYPQRNEVNLSMMWCMLVIGFAVKHLFSLMLEYFKSEDSIGERSTCIVMGFVFMLISMVVLIVDENTLELGLENAYQSFNDSASSYLNKQGLESSGPASKIVLKFFIAMSCGLLGALYTFPGMRIAKMHWDLLKYYTDNKPIQVLLNINFVLPFILVILWIKPISRNYLTERIFAGSAEPLLKPETFETIRLIAIISTMLLKIILTPWNLQAYLNIAYHRIEEQKREAGRITNVDLQKRVAAIFYYLCVAALQYLAPVIICLYLTFMYKTLGGFTWSGTVTADDESCPADLKIFSEESILKSAKEFHLALESLKSVFTMTVFRGLLGFATWWSCFVYFATTAIGMVYQSYFNK